jgi:hypothetical protein
MGVILWGASPPVRVWGSRGSSVYPMTAPIDKVRGEDNCGRGTDRGEEVKASAARRRTEASSNLDVPRRRNRSRAGGLAHFSG